MHAATLTSTQIGLRANETKWQFLHGDDTLNTAAYAMADRCSVCVGPVCVCMRAC